MFNDREMHSRYEIGLEQYIAERSTVEANLTLEIGSTVVLPAAVRYQTELALNVGALKAAGVDADLSALEDISAPLAELRAGAVHAAHRAGARAPGGPRWPRPSTRMRDRCCRR